MMFRNEVDFLMTFADFTVVHDLSFSLSSLHVEDQLVVIHRSDAHA